MPSVLQPINPQIKGCVKWNTEQGEEITSNEIAGKIMDIKIPSGLSLPLFLAVYLPHTSGIPKCNSAYPAGMV